MKYIAYNITKIVYTHFRAKNWWGVFFPIPIASIPIRSCFLGKVNYFLTQVTEQF